MRRRTRDDGRVEFDTDSPRTLGLEELVRKAERTDAVVSKEHHRAGEKCRHWIRLPDGRMGTMGEAMARTSPCRWCMGGGVLLGDMTINKRAQTKSWVTADDFRSMEAARRGYRPRQVA